VFKPCNERHSGANVITQEEDWYKLVIQEHWIIKMKEQWGL
jgi:hypothetical protein